MKKFAGWLKRLNKPERILLVVAVLILLALATSSGQDQKNLNVAPASDKSHAKSESKPKITTKTVTETQDIALGSTTVDDSNLAKGKTEIRTQGVNGTGTLTYKLTYENGEQTKKELISNDVTQQPVTQVTAVGTYVAQQQAQNQTATRTTLAPACRTSIRRMWTAPAATATAHTTCKARSTW